MKLEPEVVTVNVEGIDFVLREQYPAERNKLYKASLESGSDILLAETLFVTRLVNWSLEWEMTDDTKRLFFNHFFDIATEIIKGADVEIDRRKREQLKNLKSGVSGTAPRTA